MSTPTKAQTAAEAWLQELVKAGNLDETTRTALTQVFTRPEVVEYVGKSQLRQSDYDRQMNQAKEAHRQKLQEVAQYERDLVNWRATTEKSVGQVHQELAQARAEATRLRATAQSFGLDDDDLGQPVAPLTTNPGTPNPNPATVQNFDPNEYLRRADIEDAIGKSQVAALHTLLPAEINDIVAEHMELFGKIPNGMRQVVEQAVRDNRPIRQVWEETFSVNDKRQELETQRQETEISRRVEEKITAWRSQNPSVPIPRRDRERSPLLVEFEAKRAEAGTGNEFADRQSAVAGAVQYWNTLRDQRVEDN